MSVQTMVFIFLPFVLFFEISAKASMMTKILKDDTIWKIKTGVWPEIILMPGCKSSRDCQPYEICDKDSCQCSQGKVRHKNECFPVKTYGEECSYDVQCNDVRMVCINNDYDVRQKRFCVCDIFHLWNSTARECLEISNITQIAGNFREAYNVTGILEKSAQKVFLGVVIAGLIFVSILLSFIGICSIYGCCTKHKKGRYGEDDLGKEHINEVAVIGLPSGTYEAIETDFSGMAAI